LPLIFGLPKRGVGEDVEKICAVSARDSEDRDFHPLRMRLGRRRLE
jgi:hypothetical protein